MAAARGLLLAVALALAAVAARAGEADVVGAEAREIGDGVYRFEVTLRHADEGWDHYANAWEVVAPDGAVLATRVLAHPHVNEQPFTRNLSGVVIPDGIASVRVRARDSVHGHGGREIEVAVPRRDAQ